eukprot:scaffold49665_cov109-Cyclotella_meneghiniana.AAC.1
MVPDIQIEIQNTPKSVSNMHCKCFSPNVPKTGGILADGMYNDALSRFVGQKQGGLERVV